jgi:hypothetical protein
MQAAGFAYRHLASIDMFVDGPNAKARDAVQVIFAGERVRPEYALAAPDEHESVTVAGFRLITLEALVRMKLTSHMDKDRVHVRDLISVGLVDDSWHERFPIALSTRLRVLLDDPDG